MFDFDHLDLAHLDHLEEDFIHEEREALRLELAQLHRQEVQDLARLHEDEARHHRGLLASMTLGG